MKISLSRYEKETIINFNEVEDMASIFTYNKSWQKHLEKRLGLKVTWDNGSGGKEYHISKKRIKPPRVPRVVKLTDKQRAEIGQRLAQHRKKSTPSP